jgi:hypothetical protein
MSLSLAEARQAGRVAHQWRPLYGPVTVDLVTWHWTPHPVTGTESVTAYGWSGSIDRRRWPRTGWYHAPDCDCEFAPRCRG